MSSEEEYLNFDQFADIYDFTRDISDDLLNLFLTNFLELTNQDGKLKNILEIGCGTGRISKIFAINNFNITGVDVSEKMLEIAIEKAKKGKWSFTGLLTDARNLPFKDNEFDIAFTVHVLHLIKDWKKIIREALRCSKTKKFVDIGIEKSIYSTSIMKEYWKFINDSGFATKYATDKRIGAKDSDEVIQYMKSEGFNCIQREFSIKTNIKCQVLIDITQSKGSSSQRFLPYEIHNLAMDYLTKHDYFLPLNQDSIEIDEKGKIYLFLKD